MANSNDDIEAAPQQPCNEPQAEVYRPNACKRTAVISSIALSMTAIAIGIILSSKPNIKAQPASANRLNATALFLTPDKQIPQGSTACYTEESCNQRRLELGFRKFVVSDSIIGKGCFSRRKTAYFGIGGTTSQMSTDVLRGNRERIWCKEEKASRLGEKIVTYLAPFERIDKYGPNIELHDGTFYELTNLPPDYDDSEWITGVTTLAIPMGAKFNENGTVDMQGMSPIFVDDLDTRSKSRFVGTKTVLVIRTVAANNKAMALGKYALSDSIFGIDVDKVNLVSQFDDCSYGKLKFIPASDRSGRSSINGAVNIVNGVATVRVPVNVTEGTAVMRNAISRELNTIFGTTNPSELADYVIYCLPPGAFASGTYSDIGYAYYNNWLSVFNNQWCTSVSLQMHEIGHSLNFGHSNEEGKVYEDGSGNMGASYKSSDRPKMCFNAAKSYQTGWYKDKEVIIGRTVGQRCFNGTLHGIADYPKAATVLLKISGAQMNMFVNFNSKRGINQGTQEGANQVLVVSRVQGKRDSFAVSDLVAKLSSGDSFNFKNYEISVGEVDVVAGTAEVTVLSDSQKRCARTV